MATGSSSRWHSTEPTGCCTPRGHRDGPADQGSIYLHYKSRQDLLAGLQADLWRQLLERPRQIIPDEDQSWAEKLDAVVEHWMRFEFDRHDLYHAVFQTITAESLRKAGRGIGYTKSPFAYLFTRVC